MVYAACAVLALLGVGAYVASVAKHREAPADDMIVGALFVSIAVMTVIFGLTLQTVGSLDRMVGVGTAAGKAPATRAASM